MATDETKKSIIQKLAFICLSLLILVILMTPLTMSTPDYPFPDLLTCFIFAFFINNKINTPWSAVLVVSLLADLLWFRPVGLFTFFTVVGIEAVRWHLPTRNTPSVFVEMIYFYTFFVAVFLCVSFVKIIAAIPTTDFYHNINFVIFTLLTYPVISVLVKFFLMKKKSGYEN